MGTQEKYASCLDVLTHDLGLDLQEKNENRGKNDYDIPQENLEEIIKLNQDDIHLYKEAESYLAKRLDAAQNTTPFCFHGGQLIRKKHCIGWAFFPQSTTPVKVGLYINGRLVESKRASEYRKDLRAIGAPRQGYCGFRFQLGSYRKAQTIEIRELTTDQILFSSSETNQA